MVALIYLILSIFAGSALAIFSHTEINTALFIILGTLISFIGLVLLHFLALVLISLFIDKNKPPKTAESFYRYFMLSCLSLFFGLFRVRVKVSGREKLPDTPFLLVGNHQSVFDPMIEMLVLRKHKLAFVSKKENIAIPLGGKFMVAGGCISLDRENNRSAAGAISSAADAIKSGRFSMGIYPEGKTNRKPKEVKLLPFHSGSFKIASKSEAPIVIAVIGNSRGLEKRFFRPVNKVTLDIVDVIPPEAYKGLRTQEISDTVKEKILNFYDKE